VKRFFQARSVREQALILVFTLIAAAWWGSSVLRRGKAFVQDWRGWRADQTAQDLWLKNRGSIMARVAAAGQTLDPAKALDSAQSFAELNNMLRGLTAELGSQRTEKTDQFAVHSVQVNIRQAALPAILQFYEKLSARAPYLGIDQCALTTDRSRPGLLNASFRIYSIEVITPPAK
jgi:hypothetical protein